MVFRVLKDYIYSKLLEHFEPMNGNGCDDRRKCRGYVITYRGINGSSTYSEYVTVCSVTALAGYLYACVLAVRGSGKWQKVKVCAC